MKYQKRNKSRIRENENTLLDNDLGKQKEKKNKFHEHIFTWKDCGCKGYLNQENKDAVMKNFHFRKTDEMPHWIRVKETF